MVQKYIKMLHACCPTTFILGDWGGKKILCIEKNDLWQHLFKKSGHDVTNRFFWQVFFNSPDIMVKVKNVAQLTSIPTSGWSAQIVKIFLDKKLLQV